MPIDPSIPLQVRTAPISIPYLNPLQQAGAVLSLRGLMQQQQLGGIELQKARMELQQWQNLSQLFGGAFGGGPAPLTAPAPLVSPVPGLAPAVAPIAPGGINTLLAPVPGLPSVPGAPPALTPPAVTPPAVTPPAVTPAPGMPDLTGGAGLTMPGPSIADILHAAPTVGLPIAKNMADVYKTQIETAGKQLENTANRWKQLGSVAQSVQSAANPAAAYKPAILQAWSDGILTQRQTETLLAHPYNPDEMNQFISRAQTNTEQTTNAKTALETHTQEQKHVADALQTINDQPAYNTLLADIKDPSIRRMMPDTWSPQLKSVYQGWSVGAKELPELFQKNVQNAAQILAPARARGQEAFDTALQGIEDPKIRGIFKDAGSPLEVQQLALTAPQYMEIYKPVGDFERDFLPAFAGRLNKTVAQLTPQERIQAQQDFKTSPVEQAKQTIELVKARIQLGQMPTQEQAQAVAGDLVAHKISPDQLTSLFAGRGEEGKAFNRMVYSEAKKIQPDFNFEQAAAEYQLVKSPQFQNTVRYMDSVAESLPQLIDRAQKLGNFGVRSVNDLINQGKEEFNNINLKRFNTDRLLLADEVAKILQGGGTGSGTSDAKLQQAEQIFRANDDPSAIRAGAEEVTQLIGNRRRALTRGTYFENNAPAIFQGVSNEVKQVLSDPKYAAGKAYPGSDGSWYKKNADGTIERMIAPPPNAPKPK